MKLVSTLAIYWGPRFDSAEQCAQRIGQTFSAIERSSPYLSSWYHKGASHTTALETDKVSNFDVDQLTILVKEGVNRKDMTQELIPELGYRISLWNKGNTDEASSLSITCGLHSKVPGLSNCVVLVLPMLMREFVGDTKTALLSILEKLVGIWHPDWGGGYDLSSKNISDRRPGHAFFDQLLWVSDGLEKPSNIADASSTKRLCEGILYLR